MMCIYNWHVSKRREEKRREEKKRKGEEMPERGDLCFKAAITESSPTLVGVLSRLVSSPTPFSQIPYVLAYLINTHPSFKVNIDGTPESASLTPFYSP